MIRMLIGIAAALAVATPAAAQDPEEIRLLCEHLEIRREEQVKDHLSTADSLWAKSRESSPPLSTAFLRYREFHLLRAEHMAGGTEFEAAATRRMRMILLDASKLFRDAGQTVLADGMLALRERVTPDADVLVASVTVKRVCG